MLSVVLSIMVYSLILKVWYTLRPRRVIVAHTRLSDNVAGTCQFTMPMRPRYDGEFIPGCPVGSHLIPAGSLVDRLSIFSIYNLTKSRLQTGLVLGFSFAAFIAGIVTISTTWFLKS
jgi:hypothetical protein